MANSLISYADQWQAEAAIMAEEEPVGGASNWLSTKGGILSFNGARVPGNQLACVVVGSVKERAYFDGRYSAREAAPPVCFALGRPNEDTSPHPNTEKRGFNPQSETCATCPQNEWGSSDTGRGKACKDVRRLALLQAGTFVKGKRGYEIELFTSFKHFRKAPLALLKVPVTSVKEWAEYVQATASAVGRPPHMVTTHIELAPDESTTFKFRFSLIEPLEDELYPIIKERVEEASAMLLEPYTQRNDNQQKNKLRR